MTVRFVRGKSLKKIKGVQLDKEKLGNKMLCPECGTKFYDLNKPEIICPSCGFNISELIMKETESSKIEDKNISEVSESKKTDNDELQDDAAESDLEILDENEDETIPEIDEDSSNIDEIDELEEFEINEEIDDDDGGEFLNENDDDSVEDVISSVKTNDDEE